MLGALESSPLNSAGRMGCFVKEVRVARGLQLLFIILHTPYLQMLYNAC